MLGEREARETYDPGVLEETSSPDGASARSGTEDRPGYGEGLRF
jgi:hypothetical protein